MSKFEELSTNEKRFVSFLSLCFIFLLWMAATIAGFAWGRSYFPTEDVGFITREIFVFVVSLLVSFLVLAFIFAPSNPKIDDDFWPKPHPFQIWLADTLELFREWQVRKRQD